MLSFLAYALPLAILILALAKISRRRRPAPGKKRLDTARTPERIKKEEELLARLRRLKRRTDNVAQAVDRDPRRAANAVRAMMKSKN